MKNRILLSLFCILFAKVLLAQNLVPNGDFETYFGCPEGDMQYVKNWIRSSFSTEKYFNKCSKKKYGYPSNLCGYQYPHTGNAYVGIYPRWTVLQAKLSKPLIKDSVYYAEFYISLGDKSKAMCGSFSAVLTREKFGMGRYDTISGNKTRWGIKDSLFRCIMLNDVKKMKDSVNWNKVCGYVTAAGGEQYIAISAFLNGESNLSGKTKKDSDFVYERSFYYIDDVSVVQVKSTQQIPLDKINISNGALIRLANMNFDFDKSSLKSSSFAELNQLVLLMKSNSNMQIEISGHTDNSGTEEHNQKLSQERANAVMNYLVSKGIQKSKIAAKGYGSGKPIASNADEQGKVLNRRVEFLVVKK